jgi:glyoxylase-like metal-dependent hydrolase (beta-lactamase superfamily II)
MLHLSRRAFVASTALAAAAGFAARWSVPPALAREIADGPRRNYYRYKVGTIEVTALYDGIWEKPHDPAFIRNASIDETREALAKAGLATGFVPIPLTVIVLTVNGRHIMVDSGSGDQWQPTAHGIRSGMQAAGIDPAGIGTILLSHFHPDHIFGLMERGTNRPVFPDAELIVSAAEYRWWTEPGRVEKLPPERRALGQRINTVFPTWKNFTLVEGDREVAPGIRLLQAPGHTPGHAAFLVSSGDHQLMVSNDAAYLPALLAPHPDWQGSFDIDGPLAVSTRRRLLERAIAEKMMVCGAHFPFPGAGTFVRDGEAYAYEPATT